jgi:hypothetical protein
MPQVPPGAEESDLFARRRREDHRTPRTGSGSECARDLQHRHHTGRVVIGTIVDGVAVHGATDAQVIVVRVDEDRRIAHGRVAAAQHTHHVDRGGAPGGGHRIELGEAVEQHGPAAPRSDERDRNALEVAAVAGSVQADAAHLRRDDRGGARRAA